jgi:ABC-type Fe3+-siderophore transport system permease subunit
MAIGLILAGALLSMAGFLLFALHRNELHSKSEL